MRSTTMKAKLKVFGIQQHYLGEEKTEISGLSVKFYAVAPSAPYPEDGSDENNSYARWTPSAELNIQIMNPALFASFEIGDEFYVDFTKAEKEG
jgi:hypothetical protein